MIPLLFSKTVYAKRRDRLAEILEEGRDLLILFTAPEMIRNFDTHFPFRPDSSFFYLTGFSEPEAALVMWKEKKKIRFSFFVLPRDPEKEQWNGLRWGVDRAKEAVGTDNCFTINQLAPKVLEYLDQKTSPGRSPRIWTNASSYQVRENFLQSEIVAKFRPKQRLGKVDLQGVLDVRPHVGALRLVKSAEEIKVMKKSSEINVKAHLRLMNELKSGMMEYEAQALIEYEFRRHGVAAPSYNSIVASGANATILHYNDNNCKMKAGSLLLVDAGCEYEGYASDITRTWPVSGKFTKEQRAIVEIVGEAHREAIAIVKEGVTLKEVHEKAEEVLIEGLRDLKLLKGTRATILEKQKHKRYYPHGTGHWLGIDVHDNCPYVDSDGKPIKFKSGMIFTVEPGLYFMEEDDSVDKKWRGIGVRIEDDILVTPEGSEIITEGLPRYADEIEAAMK